MSTIIYGVMAQLCEKTSQRPMLQIIAALDKWNILSMNKCKAELGINWVCKQCDQKKIAKCL